MSRFLFSQGGLFLDTSLTDAESFWITLNHCRRFTRPAGSASACTRHRTCSLDRGGRGSWQRMPRHAARACRARLSHAAIRRLGPCFSCLLALLPARPRKHERQRGLAAPAGPKNHSSLEPLLLLPAGVASCPTPEARATARTRSSSGTQKTYILGTSAPNFWSVVR